MQREKTQKLRTQGDEILRAIADIQTKLSAARHGFETAVDETLIDSYIYEIIALHKKYEYFLKEAKDLGLTNYEKKIG